MTASSFFPFLQKKKKISFCEWREKELSEKKEDTAIVAWKTLMWKRKSLSIYLPVCLSFFLRRRLSFFLKDIWYSVSFQ